MNPIAIFHHGLFVGETGGLWKAAPGIYAEQVGLLESTGLLSAASHVVFGVNGGYESRCLATALLPKSAKVVFHGLESRNENATLLLLEEWLPGHEDWFLLYAHAKGSTKPVGDWVNTRWRNCMTRHLIVNWRRCVADLTAGYEAVGCHFMRPPMTPIGQYIFAGNWWWAKASYLLTRPSIKESPRVKLSGLHHIDSRYEAEIFLMGLPRLPRIKDYHGPAWHPGRLASCE